MGIFVDNTLGTKYFALILLKPQKCDSYCYCFDFIFRLIICYCNVIVHSFIHTKFHQLGRILHGGGAFWTVRTCLISYMTKMWTENGTEAIDNGTYEILVETKQGVQQR